MKNMFKIIAIIGILVIGMLAFIVPNNPYEVLPSISIAGFDKPLWANIFIFYGFIYLVSLFAIYEKIESKNHK